jgi:hypothetical protein
MANNRRFLEACRSNNPEEVKALLKNTASIEYQHEVTLNTCLHETHDPALLQFLCQQKNAPFHLKNISGNTAIHHAVASRYPFELMRVLIPYYPEARVELLTRAIRRNNVFTEIELIDALTRSDLQSSANTILEETAQLRFYAFYKGTAGTSIERLIYFVDYQINLLELALKSNEQGDFHIAATIAEMFHAIQKCYSLRGNSTPSVVYLQQRLQYILSQTNVATCLLDLIKPLNGISPVGLHHFLHIIIAAQAHLSCDCKHCQHWKPPTGDAILPAMLSFENKI